VLFDRHRAAFENFDVAAPNSSSFFVLIDRGDEDGARGVAAVIEDAAYAVDAHATAPGNALALFQIRR
jgi:hypothetical protein